MAIDYGDARTGVAVSDAGAVLVGDAWVVQSKRDNETASVIVGEAIARGVGCIVVGHPKNMDGSIGERAAKSERFAELLRTLLEQSNAQQQPPVVIEVVLWDERLTTQSANRILSESGKFGKKRKKTIDAIAASLILESYLGKV